MVVCIDGYCILNVIFEVFNNKNKFVFVEDFNKFYFLDLDELVVEGVEIISWFLF